MERTLPQSKTNLSHEFEGSGFYLAQFKTPELAIFSYYLQSDGKAFLIDPTFQVYPYQQLADKRNVKIISIILTHYHADYITGHTQFNLPIIMGPKSQRQESILKIQQMQNNSTLSLGLVSLKVFHTPGHTLESTCFLLRDSKQNQVALFTGDTIFIGQVGRPDLSVSQTDTKQDLAKMLFNSLYKIKKQVAHSVRIYPAHGSGSACGKSIVDGNFSHLQTELQKNYALKIENQGQFIKKILQDMTKPPTYFFYDAKLNQSGKVNGFDEYLKNSLKPLSIQEFKNQLDKGYHFIDSRANFGGKTIKGSYLMNENGPLAAWTGLFIPHQSNLLLICNKQNATDLIERLLRIGYMNIKGYNDFTVDEWQQKGLPISYFKIVDGKTMVETQNKTNLDVRSLSQWKKGIIEGTKLISLNQLPERSHQLQGLDNIHVNCKTGGRARLASSILAKKGIQAVIVADNFDNFQKYGANIVEYK